jgi:hypothetical protein
MPDYNHRPAEVATGRSLGEIRQPFGVRPLQWIGGGNGQQKPLFPHKDCISG